MKSPLRCRLRFRPEDFAFMASVLAPEKAASQEAVLVLSEDLDTLGLLLDHDDLLQAILQLETVSEISADFFYFILVRHVLKQVGVEEVSLADYIAATLADFARGTGPLRPRRHESLAASPYYIDFVQSLRNASAYEKFQIHVECGNQFLVLTGIFPKFLESREQRHGAPGVTFYEQVTRRSFQEAGQHPLANEFEMEEVYQELSSLCRPIRLALNHMAEEFLFLSSPS